MKKIVLVLLAFGAMTLLIGCGPSALDITPQMEAARSAVEQARTEEAPEFCPDEFQSAEMKLKQAELLVEDDELETAQITAADCINLANLARNCAVAKKQHVEAAPAVVGPPEELKNYKASVFFDFNSNMISSAEKAKLDKIAADLKKFAKDHKFYIVLSAYCDPPGGTDDNLELAGRRALVVRYALVQNGVMRNRIYMRALGRDAAVQELGESEANTRLAADPQWRRVEISVMFERPATAMTEE